MTWCDTSDPQTVGVARDVFARVAYRYRDYVRAPSSDEASHAFKLSVRTLGTRRRARARSCPTRRRRSAASARSSRSPTRWRRERRVDVMGSPSAGRQSRSAHHRQREGGSGTPTPDQPGPVGGDDGAAVAIIRAHSGEAGRCLDIPAQPRLSGRETLTRLKMSGSVINAGRA